MSSCKSVFGHRPRRPSQPKKIVHGDCNLLLRPKISLRGLNRGVPEQKLDLLEIPAVLPTQFRASPAEVMGAEVFDPDLLR
jgi:hypothetical protein